MFVKEITDTIINNVFKYFGKACQYRYRAIIGQLIFLS